LQRGKTLENGDTVGGGQQTFKSFTTPKGGFRSNTREGDNQVGEEGRNGQGKGEIAGGNR